MRVFVLLLLVVAMSLMVLPVGATELSANKQTVLREGTEFRLPVEASEVIYAGGLVADNGSAYTEAAASTSLGPVLGVSTAEADNSAGAAGDVYCTVRSGVAVLLVFDSVATSNIGDLAYCTDDQTATLTANSVPVGPVVDYVGATSAWVYIPERPTFYDSSGGLLTNPRISGALLDSNGNEELAMTATSSAVNHLSVTNAIAGGDPTLTFTGDDANVDGVITVKGAGDLSLVSGDDAALKSGVAASDLVTISGYDVDGAAYDSNIVVTSSNDPTVTVQADGGVTINAAVTLSNAAGTGAGAISGVSGKDIIVTSGNDLTLRSFTAASDLVTISGYDVNGAAYDSNIVVTSSDTPTITLQADGGITANGAIVISDAAGTGSATVAAVAGQDITITSGDDLTLKSSTADADLVALQGYDVDGAGYKSMVLITSGNTPSVMLGTAAADLVGFYGVGPVARPGAFTQTYADADKTHAALTSTTVLVGTLGGAADGSMETIGATNGGDVSTPIMNNDQELFTRVNALLVDITDVKQALNAVIDDLQSQGLLQ